MRAKGDAPAVLMRNSNRIVGWYTVAPSSERWRTNVPIHLIDSDSARRSQFAESVEYNRILSEIFRDICSRFMSSPMASVL
jgi:hypothetical protein